MPALKITHLAKHDAWYKLALQNSRTEQTMIPTISIQQKIANLIIIKLGNIKISLINQLK
jgi:hypothetical protein